MYEKQKKLIPTAKAHKPIEFYHRVTLIETCAGCQIVDEIEFVLWKLLEINKSVKVKLCLNLLTFF